MISPELWEQAANNPNADVFFDVVVLDEDLGSIVIAYDRDGNVLALGAD